MAMKCKKCGASLHPEQKVCLDCGTETDLWPGGPTKEEKPPIDIPWTPVGIIGGGLLLLIILFGLAMHFRVVPPDQVARRWLEEVVNRRAAEAQRYTTPEFERTIPDRPASAEKGDEYFGFRYNNDADYTVSPPDYDSTRTPTSATVTVTFTGTNGQTLVNRIRLVRQGPAWKIAAVEY